jgi:hypothetical protein
LQGSSNIALSARDRECLLRWVTWAEPPYFPTPGRTAWLKLADPVPHPSADGVLLEAAKVKGVGLCDGSAQRQTDGAALYGAAREQPHFGIGSDGDYRICFSDAAPLGALVRERAQREFDNARRLGEHGVATLVPYAVIERPGAFAGNPLAVVVSLSPEPSPFRSMSLIAGEQPIPTAEDAYRARAVRALGIGGSPREPAQAAQAFTCLAALIGEALAGFTAAGLYRYSSGLSNYQYAPSWRRLLLVDLDSSRPLSELPPARRGLEALRDAAGAVHKVVEAVAMYPQLLRDVGLERIVAGDPIGALLRGYFAGAPDAAVEAASATLWRQALPVLEAIDRRRVAAGGHWPRAARAIGSGDKWTLYALAMMVGRDLLAESPPPGIDDPGEEAVAPERAAALPGVDIDALRVFA